MAAPSAWEDAVDFLAAFAPTILIIIMTLKPNAPPPTLTLPVAALLAWTVRLIYFDSELTRINAECIVSALSATTVVSIIFGAVVLFKTMEITGCLQWMVRYMKSATGGHPVAEGMLIGHNFSFIVEGAAGFGTPVALCTPILVELGHEPLNAICFTLLIDAFCGGFGACSTPIWFGFRTLGLGDATLQHIGLRVAVSQCVAGLVIAPFSIILLAGKEAMWSSIRFVYLSTLACACPLVVIALCDYEFCALGAGLIAFPITLVLMKYRVGLGDYNSDISNKASVSSGTGAGARPTSSCQMSQVESTRAQSSPLRPIQSGSVLAAEQGAVLPPRALDAPSRADSGLSKTPERLMRQVSKASNASGLCCEVMPMGEGEQFFDARSRQASGASEDTSDVYESGAFAIAKYTFPLTASVFLLVLTRLDLFGIKPLLQLKEPAFHQSLGELGMFSVSSAGVVSLQGVFSTDAKWQLQLLYTPCIIPFIVVAFATMVLHRGAVLRLQGSGLCPKCWQIPFVQAAKRIKGPTVALLSNMILVGMFTVNTRPDTEKSDAPADVLGAMLDRWLGEAALFGVAPLGALGAFVSGASLSNMTFGPIQKAVAVGIGAPVPLYLALQASAASCGNMICLRNIIGAKACVGSRLPEGLFIRRILPFCVGHCLIITLVAVLSQLQVGAV